MTFQDFIQGLRKRAESGSASLRIKDAASEAMQKETETRLGVKFPKDVEEFYHHCNGFAFSQPAIRVFPLQELTIDSAGRVTFAIIDNKHPICFQTSVINQAEQWSILNHSTGFCITFSMRSFCYNKCFVWIDKQKAIWEDAAYA